MKRLTKADILERSAVKTKDITVPEWAIDGEDAPVVTIKAWGIRDADRITKTIIGIIAGEPCDDLAPQIAAVSIVDEDGALMFGSDAGIEQLCEFAPEGIVRIQNAALHFNKLGYFATDEEGLALREQRQKERANQAVEEEDPKN